MKFAIYDRTRKGYLAGKGVYEIMGGESELTIDDAKLYDDYATASKFAKSIMTTYKNNTQDWMSRTAKYDTPDLVICQVDLVVHWEI